MVLPVYSFANILPVHVDNYVLTKFIMVTPVILYEIRKGKLAIRKWYCSDCYFFVQYIPLYCVHWYSYSRKSICATAILLVLFAPYKLLFSPFLPASSEGGGICLLSFAVC